MAAESGNKGAWIPPAGVPPGQGLRVLNSLTNRVDPFVTADPAQKHVSWYICGPTVYDVSHMGHARTFLTFDIIRRIMTDYFGYEVQYVMNITDIDDKIILRARRNYLLDQYLASNPLLDKLIADARAALAQAAEKGRAAVAVAEEKHKAAAARDLQDAHERLEGARLKLRNVETAQAKAKELEARRPGADAAAAAGAESEAAWRAEYAKAVGDALSQWLDAEKGHEVSDQKIFRAHGAKYEREFMEDMRKLGVRMPSVLTRVTEYVDKIIDFIKRIIDRDLAYEKNGSVYFDTFRFDKEHQYCKLAPQSRNNADLAEEGEGALGSAAGDKKNASDFALWKKSKPGEPAWNSPWGPGRPGWHIECSVMASDHLGSVLDVHSGGEDLRFPHHDNELAQSEAFFGSQQWVNYFLHAGHLHIQGLKMSKSLKNFITIREALADHTARQLRLLFLLQAWHQPMTYDDRSLQEAVAKERTFQEFFHNLRAVFRTQPPIEEASQVWGEHERKLRADMQAAQSAVHAALCNNFDYVTAMRQLLDLVSGVNKYLMATQGQPKIVPLLRTVAEFVHRMLSVFGVIQREDLGFGAAGEGAAGGAGEGGASREDTLRPFLDGIASFRDAVRSAAQRKAEPREILRLCDELRDSALPKLGVRLEDATDGKSGATWKLEDPKELERQFREKERTRLLSKLSSLEQKRITNARLLDKLKKGAVPPAELFRGSGEYAAFDDAGVPTADKEGKPLSKNAAKKVAKEFAEQKAAYEKHLEKAAQNANYLRELEDECARAQDEVRKFEEELAKLK
jgi:cysteinyl-tRNA synthetase